MMLSCYLLTEPNQINCYFRGEDDKSDLFTSLVVFLHDETVPGRARQCWDGTASDQIPAKIDDYEWGARGGHQSI